MSNYSYLFAIFLGVICLSSLSSCRKDHGHTHPQYNPPLYDARDQFVGKYDVWEITTNPTTQESDTAFYEMSIYKANNDSDVILEALDGVGVFHTGGCTITGIVGGDRINIPVNLCDFQNGLFYKFTGDGELVNNSLIIDLNAEACTGDPYGNADCPNTSLSTFRIDALKQ